MAAAGRNYRRTAPREMGIRVTLSCGCVIMKRADPWNYHSKFSCTNNVGHGYRLRWMNTWNVQTPDFIKWNSGYYNADGTEKEPDGQGGMESQPEG